MNKSQIISLLKEYDLKPKKSFGQNFLIDENVLQKIVQAADINKNNWIVEIGPGLGILTQKLGQEAKKVTSVELDEKLIPILKSQISEFSNVEIVNQDALKFTPPNEKYKVVANIPYYITSPLISHFLQAPTRPSKMVLLMQKEVAEKICAKAGNLNVLAIHVQIFGTPKMVSKVSRHSFHPAPKVDSAILEIDILQKPLIIKNRIEFLKVVHAGFAHKRKTILNALCRSLDFKKEIIEDALKKCDIPLMERAQRITIPQWEKLAKTLFNN